MHIQQCSVCQMLYEQSILHFWLFNMTSELTEEEIEEALARVNDAFTK